MLKSIATVSLSGALEAKLWAIGEAGFEGVEISELDLLTYPDTPEVVGGLIRDNGLACTAFQPFTDFEGCPAALRARQLDRAARKFDVMDELGTDLLLVSSSTARDASGDRGRIVADLRALAELAAPRNLRIAYEAVPWGRHINDHRVAWSIVQAVDHPAFGLCLDSFCSLALAIPNASLGEIDIARLFHVQVADAPLLTMDLQAWSRHFRCLPGQGDFDLVGYVAALAQRGYAGTLSLEIQNDRLHAGSTAGVAVDGLRALTFLLEQVQRTLHPGAAQPLPPQAECQGVEFVEFCASAEEAPQLGALLKSLGFIEAGRHRSKAVTRWRQGDINLVINSESEGFAGRFHAAHGAAVCALGLRVDDPAAMLERARGLQIGTFTQAVRPGEAELPAIAGVGGSLNYFVSKQNVAKIWDADFVPDTATATQAGAGLTRVDCFTEAMHYEDMLSWLLYYLSLFNVTKTVQMEVDDPVGMVMSQAIQSADGQLRVKLNGSVGAHTLAARFLQSEGGAGVQQVAFATNDIFASAARLRALGMEPLPIPTNYYEDLAARFGLEEPLLERMAEYNILYDRNEQGEYFQLFSRAFAKRFFFELVERRNYAGYGARNSAIRLAAQSRYRRQAPQVPGSAG
jgi:4-hydroxyphenylpyruvate dioxygenase